MKKKVYGCTNQQQCESCTLDDCRITVKELQTKPKGQQNRSIFLNFPANPVKHYTVEGPTWEELFQIKHNYK